MGNLWKTDWETTRTRFEQWWERKGMLLGMWGTGVPGRKANGHVPAPAAPIPDTPERRQREAGFIAQQLRHEMSKKAWPADLLCVAWPHLGTLPLAAYLGAKPQYAPTNVWYEHCLEEIDQGPALRFDPAATEVVQLEGIVREAKRVAAGNYFIGMPALLGGLDILAELRGAADLMIDMMENAGAVHQRLREIQAAYEPAYDRMYELLKEPDGAMCFGYFMLYGKGKVGLCQCDTSVMFSTEMFKEFVIPYLRQQCAFLDRSMYHIDGSPCLAHLEPLLEIGDLDAIEFTTEPKVPGGGSPHWYPFYKKVLAAGKALWVANLQPAEVVPCLDAIGGAGVYINLESATEAELEQLAKDVEPYRPK